MCWMRVTEQSDAKHRIWREGVWCYLGSAIRNECIVSGIPMHAYVVHQVCFYVSTALIQLRFCTLEITIWCEPLAFSPYSQLSLVCSSGVRHVPPHNEYVAYSPSISEKIKACNHLAWGQPMCTTFCPGMEHPSWWYTCLRSSLLQLDLPVKECDATLMELAAGRWREPGGQAGQHICTSYAIYVTWLLNISDNVTRDECTLRTN